MIRFGLRLTVAGGREAAIRLVLIAVAVAIGASLLLTTLALINAVDAQNSRYAWFNTGRQGNAEPSGSLWWMARGDYFAERPMGRVDVAVASPTASPTSVPVPPGIPRLPAPGEYYASPALTALLGSTPADQLADRFPGHQVGVIDQKALPAPDSLVIIVGREAREMPGLEGVIRVNRIETISPDDCDDCIVGIRSDGMTLILSVVALALLFPVLMFIGTATRLSAARREQRFAAMRLVGATPRQIAVIATVESTVAALAGVTAGFGLFFLFRRPVAAIPFTGVPFFPSDLSLGAADVLLVALGIPLGAALAARIGLRRVRVSPLGVVRRVTPRPPRAWRLIPLAAGLAELAYFVFVGRLPETGMGQVRAFLPGMFLIMGGLVLAGPWLTMVGSRMLARRAAHPASLIATRRLGDNPQAAFRAVSGLMLALFVTSVAVGVITTITANRGGPERGPAIRATLTKFFLDHAERPDPVVQTLSAQPGVKAVILVRRNPSGLGDVVSCADLARVAVFGRCVAGAQVAETYLDLVGPGSQRTDKTVFPAVPITAEDLPRLPITSIVVLTDGSTAALERARTYLETVYASDPRPPATNADYAADSTNTLTGWKQLANVVILTSLPIAGCSLAVSIAGGLSERKRPFSLLRLTGVPVRLLRRVVLLESAVPLLASAAVAIGMGFLAAHLFLTAQMHYDLRPPGPSYYVLVAIGLLASLGIIASTLPFLERITGPETARSE
jgi:cell division protein FtsX